MNNSKFKSLFLLVVFICSMCFVSAKYFNVADAKLDSVEESYSVFVEEFEYTFDSNSYVNLGFATQVFVDKNIFSQLDNDFDIIGKSLKLNNAQKNIDTISNALGICVIHRQFIEGYEIVYGYSKKISAKPINGSNIQIAWRGDTVIVGTPIILGEF